MAELTPELRADFLKWLKNGSFRGVRLGMTRAECVEKLGEPDDWGCGKSKQRAGIYRWALLEFHFLTHKAPADANDDELFLIFNDRQETLVVMFGYGYDEQKNISLQEVELLLKQVGIKYSSWLITNEDTLFDGRNIILLGEHFFAFHFNGDDGQEILHNIEQIETKRSHLKLKELP